MLIAGFAMLAVEAPEASLELHQAYASNDTSRRDALNASLERRRLERKLLIGSLLAGAVIMTVAAFLAMAPSDVQR